ncbi:MAG: hypothetical protein IK012_06935 [Fibrobacter sp.]|uniref:hypothetical protein n=1 Tax=Fibrobacter sp. TaxID=35828 RepID=UPI0025B9A005|nr:hypothetical protein [Fibrobacter sp.]MBR4784973.1 hypothetical protein [Fibrobacter sp.]
MKKIIAILFSSMMIAALSACSAASDSTISSPRMGSFIENYCTIYNMVSSTANGVVYSCEDNDKMYICSSSECKTLTD